MNNVKKNSRTRGKELIRSRYFAYAVVLVLLVGIALTSEMKLTGFATSSCNLGISVEPAIAALPTTGSINITFLFTVAGDVTPDKKIMLVDGPPDDPNKETYPWDLIYGNGTHWLPDGNFESIGQYTTATTEGIYTFELQDGECKAQTTLELIRMPSPPFVIHGTDAPSIKEDFNVILSKISVLIVDANVECIRGNNTACSLIDDFEYATTLTKDHIKWLEDVISGKIVATTDEVKKKSEELRLILISLVSGESDYAPESYQSSGGAGSSLNAAGASFLEGLNAESPSSSFSNSNFLTTNNPDTCSVVKFIPVGNAKLHRLVKGDKLIVNATHSDGRPCSNELIDVATIPAWTRGEEFLSIGTQLDAKGQRLITIDWSGAYGASEVRTLFGWYTWTKARTHKYAGVGDLTGFALLNETSGGFPTYRIISLDEILIDEALQKENPIHFWDMTNSQKAEDLVIRAFLLNDSYTGENFESLNSIKPDFYKKIWLNDAPPGSAPIIAYIGRGRFLIDDPFYFLRELQRITGDLPRPQVSISKFTIPKDDDFELTFLNVLNRYKIKVEDSPVIKALVDAGILKVNSTGGLERGPEGAYGLIVMSPENYVSENENALADLNSGSKSVMHSRWSKLPIEAQVAFNLMLTHFGQENAYDSLSIVKGWSSNARPANTMFSSWLSESRSYGFDYALKNTLVRASGSKISYSTLNGIFKVQYNDTSHYYNLSIYDQDSNDVSDRMFPDEIAKFSFNMIKIVGYLQTTSPDLLKYNTKRYMDEISCNRTGTEITSEGYIIEWYGGEQIDVPIPVVTDVPYFPMAGFLDFIYGYFALHYEPGTTTIEYRMPRPSGSITPIYIGPGQTPEVQGPMYMIPGITQGRVPSTFLDGILDDKGRPMTNAQLNEQMNYIEINGVRYLYLDSEEGTRADIRAANFEWNAVKNLLLTPGLFDPALVPPGSVIKKFNIREDGKVDCDIVRPDGSEVSATSNSHWNQFNELVLDSIEHANTVTLIFNGEAITGTQEVTSQGALKVTTEEGKVYVFWKDMDCTNGCVEPLSGGGLQMWSTINGVLTPTFMFDASGCIRNLADGWNGNNPFDLSNTCVSGGGSWNPNNYEDYWCGDDGTFCAEADNWVLEYVQCWDKAKKENYVCNVVWHHGGHINPDGTWSPGANLT